MNMIIEYVARPVRELREGNMIRTADGATRIMGLTEEGGITTIDRFHGGPVQVGSHQSVEVMGF